MLPHVPADRSRGRCPRALLMGLAFAAWTLLYATCWIVATRPALGVELGFEAPALLPADHALLVTAVSKDSPRRSSAPVSNPAISRCW